jgi:hypothetical protein
VPDDDEDAGALLRRAARLREAARLLADMTAVGVLTDIAKELETKAAALSKAAKPGGC